MIKGFRLIILAFSIVSLIATAACGQKLSDLKMSVLTPSEGQIFPYGDTAKLDYVIMNLGPDTLGSTDTIHFSVVGIPFINKLVEDLPPGGSITGTFLSAWNGKYMNDTVEYCLYFARERNGSITDTVISNDTACVQFVLKGSGVSGIADVDQAGQRQLQLRPNPANREVELDLTGIPPGESAVTIRDISGREWLRRKIRVEGGPSGRKTTINISKLPAGIYLVELQSALQRASGKLVVQ